MKCTCELIYLRSVADAVALRTVTVRGGGIDEYYTKRLGRRVSKSRHQILDVLNHVSPGALLDVGCSLGYTLRAACSLGLAPSGLEISEASAKFCRDQGYSVEVGSMANMPFKTGQFQIITMKHVLEHTPDPRRALVEVRRVLADKGGLFIAVPHGQYQKAVRNPQTSRFFAPGVLDFEGGHFIYYTPATLSRLLREEGFKVVRIHPHLVHWRAPIGIRLLQIVLAPLRWAVQRLMSGLGLKKEFWLVAVKR